MHKPAFVRGEKLVVVVDGGGRGWRDLLRPGDARVFDGGGRLEEVAEADVPAAIQRAHDSGLRAVVFCPSEAAQRRIADRLPAKVRRSALLARGRNDAAMHDLLVHPSRELLLGWSGQVPLILPSREYEDAVRDWLGHDRVAAEFVRRVQRTALRIEDFELVEEPPADAEAPLLRYRFGWRLAPWRELLLYVYPRDGEAVLGQASEGVATRAALQVGAAELAFDERGEAPIDAALMEDLAGRFDLPDLLAWRAPQRAALPSPSLVDAVRTWLMARQGAFGESRDAATWRRCAAAIARDRWLGARQATATALSGLTDLLDPGRRPVRVRGASELDPEALDTPLLHLRIDTDAVVLALDWSPTDPQREVTPREAPQVTIQVDGATLPVEVEWGARFAELRAIGLTLPPGCEYRWSWEGEANRLTVQFLRED